MKLDKLYDCSQATLSNPHAHNSWLANRHHSAVTHAPPASCTPQVGFHDSKRVRKAKVERKISDVINRLEKTRQERSPDLRAEKEVRPVQLWALSRQPHASMFQKTGRERVKGLATGGKRSVARVQRRRAEE